MKIDYDTKNDIQYPNIQITEPGQLPLGKYGQMCLNYLKEHHLDLYNLHVMDGELIPLMHKIDEEAHNRVEQLYNAKLKKDDITSGTIKAVQARNIAMLEAEEQVIREFVMIAR